jgi:ferrous iron transport protein A
LEPEAAMDSIQSLAQLHKGAKGSVSAVSDDDAHNVYLGDSYGSSVARRLVELGFIAGERVEIIEEVQPGGDPIAVRIGSSMFALRRREAQAVLIHVDAP